jgi:hypothetical protein
VASQTTKQVASSEAVKSDRACGSLAIARVAPLVVSNTTIAVLPTSHPMKREGVAG